MSTLETTQQPRPVSACEECARSTVGPELAAVLAVVVPLAWATVTRQLALRRAEADVVRVKTERAMLHERERASELRAVRAEVELASVRPPSPFAIPPLAMPRITTLPPEEMQSIPPSEPPRDLAGEPVDAALEQADTVPPRGKR